MKINKKIKMIKMNKMIKMIKLNLVKVNNKVNNKV